MDFEHNGVRFSASEWASSPLDHRTTLRIWPADAIGGVRKGDVIEIRIDQITVRPIVHEVTPGKYEVAFVYQIDDASGPCSAPFSTRAEAEAAALAAYLGAVCRVPGVYFRPLTWAP